MRYFGVRATAFMLGLQALTRQRVSKAQRYGLCEVYSRAHQGTKRSKGPAIACLHILRITTRLLYHQGTIKNFMNVNVGVQRLVQFIIKVIKKRGNRKPLAKIRVCPRNVSPLLIHKKDNCLGHLMFACSF